MEHLSWWQVLPLLSMNNSTKYFCQIAADIAEAEVGVYSACYKLGLFMVLYRTAYTLGIEPFFSAILMIKCTANLRDGNKILCHLWIIYIIVGNRFC
jgi:hypothetical protein